MHIDWNGVFGAVVPLYVAIGIAFASVRWWKIFTPEQCNGINMYVVQIGIPFLVLDLLTSTNLYSMNFRLVAADALQKIILLAVLLLGKSLIKKFTFEWVVTLFAISGFTNNIVMGIPLLGSLYGEGSSTTLIQILVFQCVIWFNVLMGMYEYINAMHLIEDQFPDTASSIASIKLEHGVSLSGREQLETSAERDANGKLNVVVRSSSMHSMNSVDSIHSIHSVHEIKSRSFAKDTFSLQSSSKRELARNPGSISARAPNFFRQLSTSNRVADESFDVDVIIGLPEPSHQQGITPKSPAKNLGEVDGVVKEKAPRGVLIKLILISLWRKFSKNASTYATAIGIVWSLIIFRFNFKTPLIIKGIITLISKTGIGMAMFSLGMSIALQPKLMPSSISTTVVSTAVRFLVGPATMAAASAAVGLKGVIFQEATIQAALPAAVICFVFARQSNVHPEILSTSVILSTVIFVPITIIYFLILQYYH